MKKSWILVFQKMAQNFLQVIQHFLKYFKHFKNNKK